MSQRSGASMRKRLEGTVDEWYRQIQDARENRGGQSQSARIEVRGLELRRLTFAGLDLSDIDFDNCDFSGSDLSNTQLVGSTFKDVIFGSAKLIEAQLQGARFETGCHFEEADLTKCKASNAVFGCCSFRAVTAVDADFEGARFGGSRLTDADFSKANLRGASGFIVDETTVGSTRFSARASDPWSILRRTYTGPRFTLNVVLLVAFVVSLIAKAFAFQVLTLLQAAPAIAGGLGSYCEDNPCETVRLTSVILGLREGPVTAIFVIASLVYNILRLGLTFGVAGLRDEEERGHRSPAYERPGTNKAKKRWQRMKEAAQDLKHWYRWMYVAHRYLMFPFFLLVMVSFSFAAYELLGDVLLIPKLAVAGG